MTSSGKLIGIMLIIGGALIILAAGAWGATNVGDESAGLEAGGFVLLLVLAAAVGLPLIAGGVFMVRQGSREAEESAEAARLRKILDMVKTQGQVPISDAVIELQSDTDTVKDMLHRLVGMGVFSGYINWEKGVLYSADAAGLRELRQCKNCGGDIRLTGKGVASCPWCGTEYFLT